MIKQLPKRSGQAKKIVAEHFGDAAHTCWFCGLSAQDILEIAHIDQDRSNDHPDNLAVLCPTCHRLLDVGAIAQDEIVESKAAYLSGVSVPQPSPLHQQIADDIKAGQRTVDWGLLTKGGAKRAGLTIRRKSAAKRAWLTRRRNESAKDK